MKRWILFGVLMWSANSHAQTTVNGRNPQLPDTLGPNGGLKVECIAGTCTGSGPGAPAATVAIDQTTDGVTNGVYVKNFPLSFASTQSGVWTVGVSGSVDISDRSGRLLGAIANTGFNVTNFPATQAVTQSGTWTSGRSWNLLNTTDSVNIGNYPATQAVTQSGTWNVGVNNFPTAASTSAVSVRCVNAAGNAFESCAGAGGGTSSTVAISQTGTDNDVDATVTNWPATQAVTESGTWTVGVNNFPATQAVSGTLGINNFPTQDSGQGVATATTQRIVLAQEATYSAGTTIKTATAAGTGPFFSLCGSATRTIRVQRIAISGTVATAAVWGDVILKTTSTATSGGTATALTRAPYDSTSPAVTATANFYTVLATTAGTLRAVVLNVTQLFPVTVISTTLQPTPAPIIYIWRDQDAEAPTLRGTGECLTANFGTTTTNAPTLSVSVAWTEK